MYSFDAGGTGGTRTSSDFASIDGPGGAGILPAMGDLGPETACLLDLCRELRRTTVRALKDRRGVRQAAGRSIGDVQYRIDRLSEEGIAAVAARCLAPLGAVRLMTEGLPPEGIVIAAGRGRRRQNPVWRVLVDPIDGTRGLMYGKRPAYVLAGIAPETAAPRFEDLVAAAMYEIAPLPVGEIATVAAAARGKGARVWRERTTAIRGGASSGKAPRPLSGPALLAPSTARTLAHGFATFNRFLDGAQDAIGGLAEDFFDRALKPAERGHVFEDQFICNAGQMLGLLTGQDRMVADLRPLFRDRLGRRLAAAHPYDVLAALILQEAGCPVTDATGAPLNPPLDVVADVAWVGYANRALRKRYEPALLAAIRALPAV